MARENAGLLRNRKAFQLLGKLSSRERKGFRNFLGSPLFNPHASRRNAMLAVFDRASKLKVWAREVSPEAFVKGTDLPADRNGFDKLLSAFYDKADEFTGILAFRENRMQQDMAAIRFLKNRGAGPEELQKRIHLAEKSLEATPQDAEYFQARLRFDLEFAPSLASRLTKAEEGRFGHLHAGLDRYFYIQKLRFLCATVNEQYLAPGIVTPPVTPEALVWIRRFENPPLLGQLYLQTYQILIGEGSPAAVETLIALLREAACMAFSEDIEDIYGYLINSYIRRLNRGDTSVLQALDQLHEGMLQLQPNGEAACISQDTFKNIVSVKSKLRDFQGARAFMAQFQARLCDGLDGIVLAYNTAVIHFHEGNYALAIPILEQLLKATGRIKADQFLGLDSRGILLKCYYELLDLENLPLVEWEELLEKANALIRSLKPFIARRGLPGVHQEVFTRFWSLYRDLFHLRFQAFMEDAGEKEAAWSKMAEVVRALPHFADRDWFREKINANLPAGGGIG